MSSTYEQGTPRVGYFLKAATHFSVLVVASVIAVGVTAYSILQEDVAPMEALHVALPASVLFVEFYMLFKISRESLEREAESITRAQVIKDLNGFRIAMSRGHYLQELRRGIRDAQSEILFTTATMATSSDPQQKKIIDAVREREVATEGLIHKGIAAKLPAALPGAIELVSKTKTELRFRSYVGFTRLRFQVTDREFSVIGVPNIEGEHHEVYTRHMARRSRRAPV